MLRFFQALLIISVAIGTGRLFGQQRNFTMEEAVLRQRGSLWPETLNQFRWRPSAPMYSYMRGNDTLRIAESGSGKRVDALIQLGKQQLATAMVSRGRGAGECRWQAGGDGLENSGGG